MTELKTLKDIDLQDMDNAMYIIKEEAINWVKEDIAILNGVGYKGKNILERWMKRLNISEEDLK